MLGVLAVLSVPILVLGDRAAIVQHSGVVFGSSADRDPEEPVGEAHGNNPEETIAGTSPAEAAAGRLGEPPEEAAAGSRGANPEEPSVAGHAINPEESAASMNPAEAAAGSHGEPPEEAAAGSHRANPEEPAAEVGSSAGAGVAVNAHATNSSGGPIKELAYDAMRAVSKELQATVKAMNGEVAGELTRKANDALTAGAAYAALLKEQYAGHMGFETGVKTFRSIVSDQHHRDTAVVRKALESSTAGVGDNKTQGESMLTTEEEAGLLMKHATAVADKAGAEEEERIEREVRSEEADYDPKAMHFFLRWRKDVDLDLHLRAPDSKEVDSAALDQMPTQKAGENFIVKAAMKGKGKGGWYTEDICSAPGVLLPNGRYRAWATYASGVPGQKGTAPTKDEDVDVPFEAEFKLGDKRKLVKDKLVWQRGKHFHKINNSMLVFDFTVKGDNLVVWDS